MSKIVVMRGLPASGKSTKAEELRFEAEPFGVVLSRDAIRAGMFGAPGKTILDPREESVVTKIQEASAREALGCGFTVIIDDMNLRNEYVKRWDIVAQEQGAEFEIVDLTNVSVEACVQRDWPRVYRVGQQVIRDLYQRYVKGKPYPLPYERKQIKDGTVGQPYVRPDYKPLAIIVDIDGTVALHTNRGPYDYSLVSTDEPNAAVVRLVEDWAMQHPSGEVLFTSGRPDSCRKDTEEWLEETFGRRFIWDRTTLLMRRAEDKRNDSVVKLELFDKHIRYDYRVEFVLDDRNRVVDMWRSLGLTCLQVAPGNF